MTDAHHQSDSALIDAARRLKGRGFAVCWVAGAGDGKATKRTGWTFGEEPEEYRPGMNLGLVCGTPSGDLIAVDIDDADAVARADEFLPATGMSEGRPGKPASHRWYRLTNIPPHLESSCPTAKDLPRPGPKSLRWQHAQTGACIVEAKGTGAQCVVPPSLHPAGPRTWDADGEPAVIDAQELYDAVERLASACGARSKADTVASARAYIDKIPPARSGQGGHDAAYRVARLLVNDHELPPDDAAPLLSEWNDRHSDTNGEERWTADELAHKLQSAVDAGPDARTGSKAGVPDDDVTAQGFAASFLAGQVWRFWNDEYLKYDGTRYEKMRPSEVRAAVANHVKGRVERLEAREQQKYSADRAEYERKRDALPPGLSLREVSARVGAEPKRSKRQSVSKSFIGDVLTFVEAGAILPAAVPMPSMLPDGKERDLVAMRNGLFDVGSGKLHPHSADWFSRSCLPYNFEPDAVCPVWDETLRRCMEGDPERVAILQEFAGLCLIRCTAAHAALFLCGSGGNGKSTILSAITALLGRDNVSNINLSDFDNRFSVAQTHGKLANITAESGHLGADKEEVLKKLITGDYVSIERKGVDGFSVRPTARWLVACNTFPRFGDRTDAIWRRLITVPLGPRIKDGLRRGMDDEDFWTPELPGIFLWAVEGLQRLRKAGLIFTSSKVCEELKDEQRTAADPVRRFLTENLEADDSELRLWSNDVYKHAFRQWAVNRGYDERRLPADQVFARGVVALFPDATKRVERSGDKRAVAWKGLRPREDAEEEVRTCVRPFTPGAGRVVEDVGPLFEIIKFGRRTSHAG